MDRLRRYRRGTIVATCRPSQAPFSFENTLPNDESTTGVVFEFEVVHGRYPLECRF